VGDLLGHRERISGEHLHRYPALAQRGDPARGAAAGGASAP
jgi:hypothetical protein